MEEDRFIELLRAELTPIRLLLRDLTRFPHAKTRAEVEPFPKPGEPAERDARTFYCSFCGKSQNEVRHFIAGPGKLFICDECVDLCAKIIREKDEARAKEPAP